MSFENKVYDGECAEANTLANELARNFPLKETGFSYIGLSNDDNWDSIIDEITEKSLPNKVRPRAAILIGQSRVLSISPALKKLECDLVVVNDVNDLQLQDVQHEIETLRAHDNRASFKTQYFQNNPILNIDEDDQKTIFEEFEESHGDDYTLGEFPEPKKWEYHHILHNEENYAACHNAAKQLTYVTTGVSWFDLLEVYNLISAIKENFDIVLINITDLMSVDSQQVLNTIILLARLLESNHSPYISHVPQEGFNVDLKLEENLGSFITYAEQHYTQALVKARTNIRDFMLAEFPPRYAVSPTLRKIRGEAR